MILYLNKVLSYVYMVDANWELMWWLSLKMSPLAICELNWLFLYNGFSQATLVRNMNEGDVGILYEYLAEASQVFPQVFPTVWVHLPSLTSFSNPVITVANFNVSFKLDWVSSSLHIL